MIKVNPTCNTIIDVAMFCADMTVEGICHPDVSITHLGPDDGHFAHVERVIGRALTLEEFKLFCSAYLNVINEEVEAIEGYGPTRKIY